MSIPLPHLSSFAARPLRFAATGATAGAVQLLLLLSLTHRGWHPLVANTVAFLLAAQLNFALSSGFTWRDRTGSRSLARRWVLFHGSIALMALVNMLVFALARTSFPAPVAALIGIAAGAGGNYLLGDRLIFRRSSGPAPVTAQPEFAA